MMDDVDEPSRLVLDASRDDRWLVYRCADLRGVVDVVSIFERFFDKCADGWKKVGDGIAKRPAQLIAYLVALVITIGVLSTALVVANNRADINSIQHVLCSGDPKFRDDSHNIKLCRNLTDQLLRHPTPQQAERLREIMRGK